MIHDQDPEKGCDCGKFNDKTLREGCENFKSLYWNNPVVQYEVLDSCPDELKQTPPCWNDNSQQWPLKAPAKCASPFGDTVSYLTINKEENIEIIQ